MHLVQQPIIRGIISDQWEGAVQASFEICYKTQLVQCTAWQTPPGRRLDHPHMHPWLYLCAGTACELTTHAQLSLLCCSSTRNTNCSKKVKPNFSTIKACCAWISVNEGNPCTRCRHGAMRATHLSPCFADNIAIVDPQQTFMALIDGHSAIM